MFSVGPETGNTGDHVTASAHARRHVEFSQAVMQFCLVENIEHTHRRHRGDGVPGHVTVRVDYQFYATNLHRISTVKLQSHS